MIAAIETQKLCKNFGGLVVADAIDFRLEQGARHALIGPNGAGKTTFVNLVTGVLVPSSGGIILGGENITALPQAQRVKRGLVRFTTFSQEQKDKDSQIQPAIGGDA